MSILIKNMTKPNDCFDCFFSDDELGCFFFTHDCPLVEVPTPHGDLVDRDYLLSEYDRQHKGPAGGARRIMEQAKTVIKAEGE